MSYVVNPLSDANNRVVIPVGEPGLESDGTVTLVQAGNGNVPVRLARPVNDDGAGVGKPSWQFTRFGIGFDHSSTTKTNTGILRVKITNAEATPRQVILRASAYVQGDPPYFTFGNFTGDDNSWLASTFIRFELNGVTGTRLRTPDKNTEPVYYSPYMGGFTTNYHTFVKYVVTSNPNNEARVFTLNPGENTLDISTSFGGHGEGFIIDSLQVVNIQTGNTATVGRPAGVQDVIDHNAGEAAWNTSGVLTTLAGSSNQTKGVVFVGSSLLTRPGNGAMRFRDLLARKYGVGGSFQKASSGGSSSYGEDISSTLTDSWSVSSDVELPLRLAANNLSPFSLAAWGVYATKWLDGQPGSYTVSIPPGTVKVRFIYEHQGASGGSWQASLDSETPTVGNNDASADTYASVTLNVDSQTTATFAKSGTTGELSLAAVIMEREAGVWCGRLSVSGLGKSDDLLAKAAPLQSFLAACEVDVVIWDSINEQPGNSGQAVQRYTEDFKSVLSYLRPAGGHLVLADLMPFSSSSWSDTGGGDYGPLQLAGANWLHDKLAMAVNGLLDTEVSWISGHTAGGMEAQHQHFYEAGYYADQGDPSVEDPRSVVDFHAPATGTFDELIGNSLYSALTGEAPPLPRLTSRPFAFGVSDAITEPIALPLTRS